MPETSGDAEEVAEQEPPAQIDPSGRWTRTNDILGKGAFKTVYKGFDEQEGIEVAWNQIRVNELITNKEDRERLFAEIRVLKQLKHKNIMTFFDSWLENKGYTVNFITELFTSGTLRQYRKRHKHMDLEVMKRWAWQILCGLVYLHGHTPPIIHRDLKCDNIFINGSEGVVKIGDLGLATMLRARTTPQSVLGTPEFMAPELYDEEYDDRVDVYSFGMCLLELATLEYPYSECRNAAQIYRKVTLGVRPKALSRVNSKELADFVGYCIQPRADRPRSRQLLKHPYFDSIRAERCSVKLSAEALGLPVPEPGAAPDLGDYANSAASSSVSRTSSAAGELHTETAMLLDAVPEEDEASTTGNDILDLINAPETQHEVPIALPEFDKPPSPTEPALPAAEDVVVDSERDFKVKGRLQADEDKLNLRLRIQQPERAARVVEFAFDLSSDTAMSVASEMVEDLSLSHTDAHRIAHAIKEEIFNLTQSVRENGSASAGAEHGFGHSSDDEGGGRRQALSDSGLAEHTAIANIEPVAELGQASFKDAMSVCGTSNVEGGSPRPQQPSFRTANGSALSSFANASPPDSHMSFGSSPAAEPMLVDVTLPRVLPAALRRAPAAAAAGAHSTPVKPDVADVLQLLTRPEAGGQSHEADAPHQAVQWQGDSAHHSFAFALPKEEDRRLPLKKLLDNLQEIGAEASSMPPVLPVSRSDPAASTSAVPSPTLRTTSMLHIPHAGQPARQPDLRRMSYDCLSSPASTSGRQSEASNGPLGAAGHALQASRTSSPRQEGGPAGDLAGAGRGRETAEAKEARRQAAQNSLKNMESKSLEGLGTVGAGSKGAKQVPIKMMGVGRPGS